MNNYILCLYKKILSYNDNCNTTPCIYLSSYDYNYDSDYDNMIYIDVFHNHYFNYFENNNPRFKFFKKLNLNNDELNILKGTFVNYNYDLKLKSSSKEYIKIFSIPELKKFLYKIKVYKILK